ncbi:holin [Sediminivirga luteola]|uniref:Holin n=1 Tax=Sediminivirga luteola TaxID=1774748 RepID=A0A8J2TX52_9MICO|nr:holin [Sediminivirga luteola]GGA10578.1 hypothetical protein GCM10011333_11720 [Sediminivirga luteola]
MSVYASKEFWTATAERAIKTAAQTAIALIGTDQVGILDLDWSQICSVVATAVVLSFLTSVGSGANGTGPSLVKAETVSPEVVGDWSGADQDTVIDDRADEPMDTRTDVQHDADALAGLADEADRDGVVVDGENHA